MQLLLKEFRSLPDYRKNKAPIQPISAKDHLTL